MINNRELPIGFTMALAEQTDILNCFAQLSEEKQRELIDRARYIKSREEMHNYVNSMFKGEPSQ